MICHGNICWLKYLKLSILGYFVFILIIGNANAGFFPKKYKDERQYIAQFNFFKRHHALPILTNIGEKPGDIYNLRSRTIIDREACFPGVKDLGPYPQPTSSDSSSESIDISGQLEVGVGNIIRGEVAGKVLLLEKRLQKFKTLKKRIVLVDDLKRKLHRRCSFLNGMFDKGYSSGKYVIIRDVLYGNGTVSWDWSLMVKGKLSGDATKAVQKFIKVGFDTEISGKLKWSNHTEFAFNENIPAAYVPAFFSKSDLKDKSVDLKRGVDKIFLANLRNIKKLRSLFRDFKKYNISPRAEFEKTFQGVQIRFIPLKKISHKRYIEFKALLLTAQSMVSRGSDTR